MPKVLLVFAIAASCLFSSGCSSSASAAAFSSRYPSTTLRACWESQASSSGFVSILPSAFFRFELCQMAMMTPRTMTAMPAPMMVPFLCMQC